MGRVFKAVEEMDLSAESREGYLHANVKAPRMTGFLLRLVTMLLESKILGDFLMYFLKKGNLIYELFTYAHYEEPPMFIPYYSNEGIEEHGVLSLDSRLSPPERIRQGTSCLPERPVNLSNEDAPFFYRWSIRDFSNAYASGKVTPLKVAQRFISAVEDSSKSSLRMSIFINYDHSDILKQAADSTSRYARGVPLSILDGVPIAIKDEIDCSPYPTTGGTIWLHRMRNAKIDANCVKQLRECGAMLVGKTNMHELGAGTSGINPHHGATRNPYDIGKICGGSSSGSAAAVSAGLCPVALGVDGGGSVRLPASLCGVFGFKPTFGRISHTGVLPLNWTLGMVGVMSGTAEDALIVYEAIHSHPGSSEFISVQSTIEVPLLKANDLVGDIKLARYTKWFDDCDKDVRRVCHHALDLLTKNYGCEVVEVTLPEIEEMRLAHYVTIASECNSSMNSNFEKGMHSSGWDVRFAFCIYRSFNSKEYINAQRMRFRQMHYHMEIFKKADVIVVPTTGITAYPLQEDALNDGELDYVNGAALVRYQIAGNFLGLPAITVPVGYDTSGMPIGIQFIGRPYSEALLLRLAYITEVLFLKHYKKPFVYYDLLEEDSS